MSAVELRRGRWADSAKLLAAARAAEATPGVDQATCFMATPANLEELRRRGMWNDALADAGPDDLAIVVAGEAETDGIAAARAVLDARGGAGGPAPARAVRSFAGVAADLALISVPGDYAALDAHTALSAGMDVMLFSDGVSLADEVALKRRAHRLGRIVMGPGCGTAIIDGVGLAFANVVRPGSVGVVAAAGTGAQEVTTLVDRAGSGISRCYGTGGRDLYEDVGAITMLDAIERLRLDPATDVILAVSKPPAPSVAERVVAALAASGKPAAACFVGLAPDPQETRVRLCATLEDAAQAAVALAGGELQEPAAVAAIAPRAGLVRGLFSGGTLCSEAAAILAAQLGDVVTNAPAGGARRLEAGAAITTHACLDLGEEEYTRGRPHPMIDPLARAELIEQVADDEAIAVLLVDVVLGYGSHPDPAGALVPALERAGRSMAIVAHICGTEADPQVRSRQEATLREVGVVVAGTNAGAARLAAATVG